MLPPRCLRCGASSREPLCPPCVDYLVAYHPLWLDPALLPGPSLLDALGPRDLPFVSHDLERTEWRSAAREPTAEDAVRLIALLELDADARPVLSAGDADVLHAFLGRARRGLLRDGATTKALAALCRFLATRPWMPTHLAAEYGLRARTLEPPSELAASDLAEAIEGLAPPEELPVTEEAPPAEVSEAPPPAEPEPAEPGPEALDIEDLDLEPEGAPAEEMSLPEDEFEPEAIVEEEEPEPAPPAPEPAEAPEAPSEAPPAPQPPEPTHVDDEAAEREGARVALERDREAMERWVRERTASFEAQERALAEREKALTEKEAEVEEHERAVTGRLVELEKDSARRDVLRFLGTVPGMTEETADVIATAFPDMTSLEAADVRALMQCRGVSEVVARAVRYELVPGEVEDEQRAIDLREEAQEFMEEGDYKAALACYDRLLRERPADLSLWFDKAELEILVDRPEEALQCYTRVLDLDRNNRQAYFERANLLFGMGRLADALDSLRAGLRADPSKSGDIILKAEELRREGRPNDAAVLLQAVLDIDPSNQRAVLAYGDALLDLGDIDAAEGFFTRALGKDPQNARILFRKGQLLERKGRWGAAVQFFNRAIALKWDDPEPWLSKARILLAHDRLPGALESFDKALSFDPDRVDAWLGKAEAHLALREPEEASRAIDEAVDRDPTNPAIGPLRERLAASPPKAAEPEEAEPPEPSLADALKGLEEEVAPPEAPEAEPVKGIASFIESIDAETDDVHAILQLAELALEGGDAQMALVRYEEAIGRDARNADAWTGKGVALQYLERYEEALEAYDRALRIAPGHELAAKWRQTCLRHLGSGRSP